MNPGSPNVKINQIEKWWVPRDKRVKELFHSAKEELGLFLKAMSQGVLLDDIYDIMKEVCPKGAIRFEELGFLTFNDFLFHCDDLFDVKVDNKDQEYLFLRNDFNMKQQHLVKLVHGQRKDESDSLISRANTRDVSTDILVKRDMKSWINSTSNKPSPSPVSKTNPLRSIIQQSNSHQSSNINNSSASTGNPVRKMRPRAVAPVSISSGPLMTPVNSISNNNNIISATCTPHVIFPPPPSIDSISSCSSVSKEFKTEKESINHCNQKEENKESINSKATQVVKSNEIQKDVQNTILSASSSNSTVLPIKKRTKNKREMWNVDEQPNLPLIRKMEDKKVPAVGGKEMCQIKRATIGSMKWMDCHFVGIDSFGYAIVKLSNAQLIEYFETEMRKLQTFYSIPSNQDEYRMRTDEMTNGRCVVVQTNMKDCKTGTFRFIRAKIFSYEQNYCVVLAVDDFTEHIIHHNNIYHLKPEFTKTSARAILCILAGSENRMMYKDLARSLLRLKQNDVKWNSLGKGNCLVKMKVVMDLHPIYKCPVVEMKTMKEDNVIQLLKKTGEFFSFSSQNKSLTNTHLAPSQIKTLKELENRGYFFDEYNNNTNN